MSHQLKLGAQISDQPLVTLIQEDTFFIVAEGRLKLREFGDALDSSEAMLIFYQRSNTLGPKLSDYQITETEDAAGLKAILQIAYAVRYVVKKVRSMYMLGRPRLHFDAVENLAHFIMLEALLDQHDSIASGEIEATTEYQGKRLGRLCLRRLTRTTTLLNLI
jgi:adenylate cyclase class IV